MSEGKVYCGDTPRLQVDTGIDLTLATTATLRILKPNGAKVEVVGVPTATPNDGLLTYQCLANDLSVAGIYKVQAHVILPSLSKTFTGETAQFKVNDVWG